MVETKKRPATAVRLPAFAISFLILLASLTNFASGLFEDVNPSLALSFNPFNLNAKLNSFNTTLDDDVSLAKLDETADEIRAAIRFEPFNAKLFSLFGYSFEKKAGVDTQNGQLDEQLAQKLYDYALRLNHADLVALFAKLQFYAKTNDSVGALKIAMVIFRVWPQNRDLVTSVIPALLSDPEAFAIARDEFPKIEKGPNGLAFSLMRQPEGIQYAVPLLLYWHRVGVKGLTAAINTATNLLISNKQYLQAYSLFLFTLDETQKKEAGYIFNHDFKLPPSGNRFDWDLPSKAGVSSQIVSQEQTASNGNELEIKFLNTPVRLKAELQYVRLPKSTVIWETNYSTKKLQTPKPVKLSVVCINDNRVLASFAIEPVEQNQSLVEFNVPASNCDLQIISLSNENLVESWKNRYSGSLYIGDMSIRLAH